MTKVVCLYIIVLDSVEMVKIKNFPGGLSAPPKYITRPPRGLASSLRGLLPRSCPSPPIFILATPLHVCVRVRVRVCVRVRLCIHVHVRVRVCGLSFWEGASLILGSAPLYLG